MKLRIKIKQHGQKEKVVETPLAITNTPLETLRKVWEVEQILNGLPGANLRVHMDVEEDKL